MSNQTLDEQAIFHAVRQIDDPVGRRNYLQQVCGDDAALRERIDALLHVHDQEKDFLAQSPFVTIDQPVAEKPGMQIGPYKLLQVIGEGGMGVVFMAEQQEPVRRRVALKVIKPGMDTRQVIARFEAERQALAVMDHPNIARVLEAGATESGRPYFVMELVRGVPITAYCDESNLPVRERLALFAAVCQAIQHAHTKGIIHRDIKPTNVLVTRQDGQPVVKVIDFGVAKAMGQQLTEKTLFTDFTQMIGTPLYMSPEQAELSGVDIDTRSDIYSLGVLLYELLTGSTPVDKEQMKKAAFDEIRRLIREEEPEKPSTRISSAEAAPSVAAHRHTEPDKLARLVRGELDWIVMKALEKDRNRRYETANGFAMDVQRYLADEPVQACPPSARYRLRKFARRNKGPALAVTLILLALIAGVVGTTWGMVRAEQQRRIAEISAQKALAAAEAEKIAKEAAHAREAEAKTVLKFVQNKIFAAARPQGQDGGLGRDVTLRQAVQAALPFVETSFTDQPVIEAKLRVTLGRSFLNLGEAAMAADQYQKARALFTQQLGPDHPDSLGSMYGLANSYAALGRHTDTLKLHEETLALMKAKLGADHRNTLIGMNRLASSYRDLGRYAEALKLQEETLALQKAKLGPHHPHTLTSMSVLASIYRDLGRYAEALTLREEALAL
ncbi:MAG: serine/threonine-protein kinase, partial [Pirellulales bacterium]